MSSIDHNKKKTLTKHWQNFRIEILSSSQNNTLSICYLDVENTQFPTLIALQIRHNLQNQSNNFIRVYPWSEISDTKQIEVGNRKAKPNIHTIKQTDRHISTNCHIWTNSRECRDTRLRTTTTLCVHLLPT